MTATATHDSRLEEIKKKKKKNEEIVYHSCSRMQSPKHE